MASRPQTTPQEFQSMEPACQAIGMGEVDGKFWAEVLNNSPILDKPENAMAKGAGWFHHYCWGKLSKLRYFSARTAEQRRGGIHNWRSEMKFIVDWTGERGIKWQYMPVIHKEIAESYLYEKNYANAIVEGEKALALDKNYVPVYLIIADAYAGANKRDKALEIVTEGLKRAPESKPLKRRYKDLGGKLPYPEPYAKETPAVVAAPVQAEKPVVEPVPAKVVVEEVKPQAATPAVDSATQPAVGPDGKPAGNPHCRFCP
jgi:tetratricopeptide (TPR) repeat protein